MKFRDIFRGSPEPPPTRSPTSVFSGALPTRPLQGMTKQYAVLEIEKDRWKRKITVCEGTVLTELGLKVTRIGKTSVTLAIANTTELVQDVAGSVTVPFGQTKDLGSNEFVKLVKIGADQS